MAANFKRSKTHACHFDHGCSCNSSRGGGVGGNDVSALQAPGPVEVKPSTGMITCGGKISRHAVGNGFTQVAANSQLQAHDAASCASHSFRTAKTATWLARARLSARSQGTFTSRSQRKWIHGEQSILGLAQPTPSRLNNVRSGRSAADGFPMLIGRGKAFSACDGQRLISFVVRRIT
jgi:hypothetical protein